MGAHEIDSSLDQLVEKTGTDGVAEKESVQPHAGVLKRKRSKYLFLLAAGALVMILVSVLVKRPSNFEEYLSTSGYGGVFIMAVIGSASPVWPLPGSWAAFIAAGLGLNPFLLGMAAGIGEPIGELTGYTAGYGGQVAVNKWKRYAQVERWMKRHGGITIFAVSAVPNFLVKLATIAAGALQYPLKRFFFFCWGGKTVKSLGFAFAGAGFFDGIKSLIERIF